MKKLFSIIMGLTLALTQVISIYPVTAEANATTSTKITIDNTAASNAVKYIKYSDYPGIGTTLTNEATGKAWWPKRTDGCAASATTKFKSLPWLPENNGVLQYAYTGNAFLTSGDCASRYTDGGNSTGAWLTKDEFGGWANSGTISGWGTAVKNIAPTTSPSASAYSPALYTASTGNIPNTQIWGQANMDNTEHSVTMFKRNGNASYVPSDGWTLFSSGTTLFRNEFVLTQEQVNSLESVNFYAAGDDWIKVWVDGVAVAVTTNSDPITTINNNTTVNTLIKNTLSTAGAGDHVIAFQVNDKARWIKNGTAASNSNKAGLSYKLELNLTATPPATPTLSCSVTPQEGLAPLVITATTVASNYSPAPTSFDYRFQRIKNAAGEAVTDTAETITGRGSEFYYTLPNAGTYNTWAKISSSSDWQPCEPVNVVVTDPTDPDGGEVTP